ncbi:MAG: hypothetical protein WKF47_15775 [Geodermatophilaceae bacterium]
MILADILAWFSDPENWSGPDGAPVRLLEHLQYTALRTAARAVSSRSRWVALVAHTVGGRAHSSPWARRTRSGRRSTWAR